MEGYILVGAHKHAGMRRNKRNKRNKVPHRSEVYWAGTKGTGFYKNLFLFLPLFLPLDSPCVGIPDSDLLCRNQSFMSTLECDPARA